MTVSRFVAVLAGVCLTIAGVRGVYSSDLADFAPGPTTAAVAAQTTVTRHRGQFNRSVIDYQAIAAETPIVNAAGRVGARIFSVSYVKDGETTAPSPTRGVPVQWRPWGIVRVPAPGRAWAT